MESEHLEDLGLGGRIILNMVLQEVVWGGMDWTAVASGVSL